MSDGAIWPPSSLVLIIVWNVITLWKAVLCGEARLLLQLVMSEHTSPLKVDQGFLSLATWVMEGLTSVVPRDRGLEGAVLEDQATVTNLVGLHRLSTSSKPWDLSQARLLSCSLPLSKKKKKTSEVSSLLPFSCPYLLHLFLFLSWAHTSLPLFVFLLWELVWSILVMDQNLCNVCSVKITESHLRLNESVSGWWSSDTWIFFF